MKTTDVVGGDGSRSTRRADGAVVVPVRPIADGTVVVPVGRSDGSGRPAGVVIAGPDGVRYRPVIDVERLAWCAVAATGLVSTAVAVAVAARRRPAIGSVHMGPGGWVSLKGTTLPPLRPAVRRPWWARLLRARRLVVE